MDKILNVLKQNNFVKKIGAFEDLEFYKPKPSEECPDGYQGRIGIHEIMTVSSAIRDLVMTNTSSEKIEEQARKEGMLTMIEDGIVKAAQGITSIEEVFRAANS